MRAKTIFLLLLSVLVFSALGMAQESPAYNLMVSDQGTGRLEFITSVQIYAIDPETDKRLDAKPVVSESNPTNPMKVWLDPGHYEFAITVSHIAKDATFFRFEIVEGERTLIDLMKIEIPEELKPKKDDTR